MTMYRQFQTKVGIAKESTFGTGVNPTILLEVTDVNDQPSAEILLDEGLRGVAASIFDAQQGGKHGELSIEGFVYPEEIAHLGFAMMGSDTVTGAGPYLHTLKSAPTPPSYTIEVDRGAGAANGALRYTGMRCSSINFQYDAAGVLRYTSTWMGLSPTKVTAATVTAANSPMFAGWRATVTSSGITTQLISAEFNFEREMQIVHTAQNSQQPYAINTGPIRATGRMVLATGDMSLFDTWAAFTRQPFTIDITYGAGASLKRWKIIGTDTLLANGNFETDRGQIGLSITLPFAMIHNTTDGGPAQLIFENSTPTL